MALQMIGNESDLRSHHEPGIQVRKLDRKSYTEYCLTGTAQHDLSLEESASALFTQTAKVLVQSQIQPFQEKVYGLRSAKDKILALRHTVYRSHDLDPTIPVTFIEGTPVGECPVGGLQIWGIAPENPENMRIESIQQHGQCVGRSWRAEDFRMVHLPFVQGNSFEGNLPKCPTGQAENMFSNASKLLEDNGVQYSQVIRTWIYMSRLLDWYGEFNRVRTNHYNEYEFAWSNGESAYPASTGIQCRSGDEECFMDVLAVDTQDSQSITIQPICNTSRQNQAFSYGSAFSRGAVVEIEGQKTVFVSGTASINTAGESIYIGNAEAQCLETLADIAALLEDQGGGLGSISQATVFCKNYEAYDAFKRITSLLNIPEFPSVFVIADVCRHELLIEIEAMALI